MFKNIEGFGGQYSVSDTGIVISHGNERARKEKIMKTYSMGNTLHRKVDLRLGKNVVKRSVHRLVAEAFLPRIKGLNVVNHLDNNPLNNHVSNLEWTTVHGNNKHYNEHHRKKKYKFSRTESVFNYIAKTLSQ